MVSLTTQFSIPFIWDFNFMLYILWFIYLLFEKKLNKRYWVIRIKIVVNYYEANLTGLLPDQLIIDVYYFTWPKHARIGNAISSRGKAGRAGSEVIARHRRRVAAALRLPLRYQQPPHAPRLARTRTCKSHGLKANRF